MRGSLVASLAQYAPSASGIMAAECELDCVSASGGMVVKKSIKDAHGLFESAAIDAAAILRSKPGCGVQEGGGDGDGDQREEGSLRGAGTGPTLGLGLKPDEIIDCIHGTGGPQSE